MSGQDGYQSYRIPSLIVTEKKTILAFCEARKNSKSDTGDIDLVLKRSTDDGKTWSKQQIIWDDGANTCGNPCPVIDEETGTIWLLLTHNLGADNEREVKLKTSRRTRTVWICNSTDDGRNWATPVEITATTKDPAWGWYATGPGVGVQLQHGLHKGRLLIPCDHSYDDVKENMRGMPIGFGSHVIYSDNHGKDWKLGGVIRPKMNECQMAELADGNGTLLMDMRSYFGESRRAQSISHDGGATWTEPKTQTELIEPVCQASILRYTWPDKRNKSRILFSNPANEKSRRNFTVRLSYDEGKTWPVAKTVHESFAAYSCLTILPDMGIGCLYERGDQQANEKITFAKFSLAWLTDDKDTTAKAFSKLSAPLDGKEKVNPFLKWQQLPSLPDPVGFAAPFAGVSGNALIVAGGANFPNGMPWEGGKKIWHDSIFVLTSPKKKWKTNFKLPEPRAYGISITTKDGIVCIGGGDAKKHYADVFRLKWINGKIVHETLPPLPKAMAFGAAALLGNTIYVAGGIETPDATNTLKSFWALDVSKSDARWKELETWPGPARMLAVAAAQNGSFFLLSGTDLTADSEGKPQRIYLSDGYRFTPGKGWKRIADLPRPSVAAPSPAPTFGQSIFLVIGGDDGSKVAFEPINQHPGFPGEILTYNSISDSWEKLGMAPISRVTTPAIQWQNKIVIPSGEIRPGVRSAEVWSAETVTVKH